MLLIRWPEGAPASSADGHCQDEMMSAAGQRWADGTGIAAAAGCQRRSKIASAGRSKIASQGLRQRRRCLAARMADLLGRAERSSPEAA